MTGSDARRHGAVPSTPETAQTGRLVGASVIDLALLIAGAAAAGGTAHGVRFTPVWIGASVLLVVFLGLLVWFALHRRFGAGFGALVLRLRTVDSATGMPTAPHLRSSRTFDLTGGGEPVRIALSKDPLPSDASEVLSSSTPAYLTIELDDGRRYSVRREAVIGHRPEVQTHAEGATEIALTDFSRTVDRVHAAVRLVPGGIRIDALTDRGATAIEIAGLRSDVPPGTSTIAPNAVDLVLGERRLHLARRDAMARTS